MKMMHSHASVKSQTKLRVEIDIAKTDGRRCWLKPAKVTLCLSVPGRVLNTVQKILLIKHEDVMLRLTFDLCKIRAAVEMNGFSYLTATSATV